MKTYIKNKMIWFYLRYFQKSEKIKITEEIPISPMEIIVILNNDYLKTFVPMETPNKLPVVKVLKVLEKIILSVDDFPTVSTPKGIPNVEKKFFINMN